MSEKRLIELKDYFLAYPDTEYLPNMFSEVVQALEQLQQENKQLKDELEEEQWRIKIAKERDELHKECLNHIEQKKLYKEVIEEVISIADKYGQIDGSHHKLWVIDQMLRLLLGEKYQDFIKDYEENGEYTWDTGIAP